MKPDQLPEDFDTLLNLAEAIVCVLGEGQFGIAQNAEARLLAAIAAATFARSAYLAILGGAKRSPAARRFLDPARAAFDRTEQQLRYRLTALVAELTLHLDNKELLSVADYVLALNT